MCVGLHAGVAISRANFIKLILQEPGLNLNTGCDGLIFVMILKRQTVGIHLKWRA